jgi:hypothetical protein
MNPLSRPLDEWDLLLSHLNRKEVSVKRIKPRSLSAASPKKEVTRDYSPMPLKKRVKLPAKQNNLSNASTPNKPEPSLSKDSLPIGRYLLSLSVLAFKDYINSCKSSQ